MQYPLFITPHSLLSKSAIGVQTKHLLADIPHFAHLYWSTAELRTFDPRSIRIESLLFARLSALQLDPPSTVARMLASIGFSWWDVNRLKPAKKKWLRNEFAGNVSAVYAAPCEIRDCERMKEILVALQRPFILHLWDLLDDHQLDSPAFKWLLENAAFVRCVSEAMVRQLAPIRPDASVLYPSRMPSSHRAQPPANGSLRIALIGYCLPYVSGLRVLNQALQSMKSRQRRVELVYIGAAKAANRWSHSLSHKLDITGFISSDNEKDKLLSECHVGFLPGPLEPPVTDARSRFSIPSRVHDFMATGLPIVATVHSNSAAAHYMSDLGLKDCNAEGDPERLAENLMGLADPAIWRIQSQRSHAAFQVSCQQQGKLKQLLYSATAATMPLALAGQPARSADAQPT